jgi:hypothetical protein
MSSVSAGFTLCTFPLPKKQTDAMYKRKSHSRCLLSPSLPKMNLSVFLMIILFQNFDFTYMFRISYHFFSLDRFILKSILRLGGRRNSSVGIVTKLRAGPPAGSDLDRGNRFSFIWNAQTGCGAQPAPCLFWHCVLFPRSVKLTAHPYLVPRLRMVELHGQYPMCVSDIVLN